MTPEALAGGFVRPAEEAARGFRGLLEVLARPGLILRLEGAAPPAPLSGAAGVLALVLLDGTTPVHLAGGHDCPALRDWLAFHCGAPLVGAEEAAFAFGRWEDLQPVTRFAIGTPDYPDRAATLVIDCPRLEAEGARLRGPDPQRDAGGELPRKLTTIHRTPP